MDLCVLEETMFRSIALPNSAKKALEQGFHVERYHGEKTQVEQTEDNLINIRVREKERHLFGCDVLYYCFCFGVAPDSNEDSEQCIGIPAARFLQAMQRMIHAYAADRSSEDENFADWGERKGTPFFTELLDDLIVVGPEDMPQLLKHKEEYLGLVV